MTRPPARGRSRRRSGWLASAGLLVAACYGFSSGGGFPPELRSVAVLPFDNLTPEPVLTQEVSEAVRLAVENRLGLRVAAESQADIVVKGRIDRYEPDLPVVVQGNDRGQFAVTQRLVQLTVSVQMINQRTNRPLWERSGVVLNGEYAPGQEAQGRRRALELLTNTIVEGAQSQW